MFFIQKLTPKMFKKILFFIDTKLLIKVEETK